MLPTDHPVRVVLQDEDDEIKPKPNGRLQFLAVHQEAAIAAYRHDAALRIEQLAIIAGGNPAPIVASALSSRSVLATQVR